MNGVILPVDVDDWSLLDHCGARNALERDGWRFVAAGDWAVVLADSTNSYAARISPFEQAYQYFVNLCQRHQGNRWLPTIQFATDLDGGGHLTVMDLLAAREVPDDDRPDPLWSSGFPDLVALRAEVERIDSDCRRTVRWWGGVDVKGDHFMLDQHGQPKLVDPFYLSGTDLYRSALDDFAGFCATLPAERRRHILQIPHFSQPYAADDLRALRAVIERYHRNDEARG